MNTLLGIMNIERSPLNLQKTSLLKANPNIGVMHPYSGVVSALRLLFLICLVPLHMNQAGWMTGCQGLAEVGFRGWRLKQSGKARSRAWPSSVPCFAIKVTSTEGGRRAAARRSFFSAAQVRKNFAIATMISVTLLSATRRG